MTPLSRIYSVGSDSGVCWCIVKPCNIDAGKGVIRGTGAEELRRGGAGGGESKCHTTDSPQQNSKIVVPG